MSFKNIVFIGGIHGVGKSTIAKRLARELNINYLLASDVLNWKGLNTNINNKKVSDIAETQNRLIIGLENVISKQEYYILDGHFCLLDGDNIATKVPFSTFEIINPKHLVIILGDAAEIAYGIQLRDKIKYSIESLNQLQNLELTYAREVSKKLDISLSEFNKSESSLNHKSLLSNLNEILA